MAGKRQGDCNQFLFFLHHFENYKEYEYAPQLNHNRYYISIMGQAYCDSCCGGQRDLNTSPPNEIRPVDNDAPNPKFAKSVRSMIEVHPKVRETFIK